MVSIENLRVSGAGGGDVLRKRSFLTTFAILNKDPSVTKKNKLLEQKTNNDALRIGDGIVKTVQSQGKSISKILSLVIELSRSTMAMNCKITVASEQLDHHSTEAGP